MVYIHGTYTVRSEAARSAPTDLTAGVYCEPNVSFRDAKTGSGLSQHPDR